MFETQTPPDAPASANPLNPVMPAPGMTDTQTPPAPAPQVFNAPAGQVHAMPERFRATSGGSAGGKMPGSSTTKRLIMILIVVVAVAGLGIGGLFVFNNVIKTNTSTTNLAVTNRGTTNTVTNANVSNTNSLTNAATTNTAANTNAITNQGANTNAVANTNTVTNGATNANTNTSTTITKAPSSTDTDNDGLTDVEEAVYGTEASKADTDGDTFIDGMKVQADGSVIGEVANLFNPKGSGNLEASGLVKRVENSTKTYSVLVPTSWTTNESASILVITPSTQTSEFFQIRSYDNTSNQTPSQWYQATNPQAQMNLVTTTAVNGLEVLISEDGTTAYFFKDNKVYGLNYSMGGLTKANYWTTFTMMMKSFKLVAS